MKFFDRLKSRPSRFMLRALGLKRVETRFRASRDRHLERFKAGAAQANCLSFHVNDSRNLLRTNSRRGGVALVTVLPPNDTGLAEFALRLAEENPGKLDLFSTFSTVEDILHIQGRLRSQCDLHPIDLLPEATATRCYDAIVFAIGNSEHNAPIAQAVRRWAPLISNTRKCLQIHDPVLFNLSRCTLRDRDLLDWEYMTAYPSLGSRFSETSDEELLNARVTGMSALFARSGIDEIIVHSSAAARFVADDIAHGDWQMPVHTFFHPVFRSSVSDRRRVKAPLLRPVVGVFGAPHLEKRIDVVAAMIITGMEQGVIGSAVFAGYGAEQVRERFPFPYPDKVVALGNPDYDLLEQMMKECDVAVQLRARNLGESSGVIPQLLELGVPVIASRVGAFAEFADAVDYVEADAGPEEVLRAVAARLGRDKPAPRSRDYVDTHRSEEFIRRLVNAR